MIRYAVTALALTVASAAPSTASHPIARQQDGLSRALAGLTPRAPVHCISQRNVTSVKTYGDKIVYTASRNRKWLNDTGGGCSHLRDDIIVSRSVTSQYCSGDIIRTHDRVVGMATGACALGEFVPYTK